MTCGTGSTRVSIYGDFDIVIGENSFGRNIGRIWDKEEVNLAGAVGTLNISDFR